MAEACSATARHGANRQWAAVNAKASMLKYRQRRILTIRSAQSIVRQRSYSGGWDSVERRVIARRALDNGRLKRTLSLFANRRFAHGQAVFRSSQNVDRC